MSVGEFARLIFDPQDKRRRLWRCSHGSAGLMVAVPPELSKQTLNDWTGRHISAMIPIADQAADNF